MVEATGSAPGTPQRVSLNTGPKTTTAGPITIPSAAAPKKNSTKAHAAVNAPLLSKADVIPVIVPRTNTRLEQAAESRKEIGIAGRTMPFSLQLKTSDFRKFPSSREDTDQPTISMLSEATGCKATEMGSVTDRNIFPSVKGSILGVSTAERNIKDDRYTGSGKNESNLMMDPPTSYQEESCKY